MPTVTVSEDPHRFDVHTEWTDGELVKQVPGRHWDAQRKLWTVPATWAACLQLRAIFGARLVLTDALKQAAWALRQHAERTSALGQQLEDPWYEPPAGVQLFPHQTGDVVWAVEARAGGGLTNDMGTGKTPAMLVALRELHLRGLPCLPALVVCPNSVKGGWAKQAPVWFPEATPYVLSPGAGRAKVLKTMADDPTALVIVNYESARTLSRLAPYGSVRLKRCPACGGGDQTVKETSCETHLKALNLRGFRTVVVDEAHALKDPKAKQTRAVWALGHGDTVVNRYALTGTPVSDHIGDWWSIGHFLDRHTYPTRSAFIERYALLGWNAWGGTDIIGIRPDTEKELFSFVDAHVRRVSKAQANLGLPPKLRQVRAAQLPPKALKAYRELEADLVTTMPDGSVVFAPNQLTQTLRLLQLSSAFSEAQPDGALRLVDKPPSWKIDELMAALEELGPHRPFGVAALSRQLIELASDRLTSAGIRHGLITGRVTTADRQRYLQEFGEGKLRAMLFTIQAGGTGVDGLQVADTVFFLQRSWSIIQNKQAEDRFHRIGSEVHESVNIVDILAPDTVEVRQVERLHEKLALLEQFNRDGGSAMMFNDAEDDLRGLL
jgi:hypothetical protein